MHFWPKEVWKWLFYFNLTNILSICYYITSPLPLSFDVHCCQMGFVIMFLRKWNHIGMLAWTTELGSRWSLWLHNIIVINWIHFPFVMSTACVNVYLFEHLTLVWFSDCYSLLTFTKIQGFVVWNMAQDKGVKFNFKTMKSSTVVLS